MNDKYIKEYEEMDYYDLADELVEPLSSVKQNEAKTIYVHYAKERDENEQLQNNWNELKNWLEETIKQYDNVGLKFKKESNFECASRSYDYLKQYQTMLDKMQELQGDDKN